jgi:translation initiation factor 1 (eIF-1/SUI1)
MATAIYKTKNIFLFDGTEIEIMPLKIKYLREFMDAFDKIKNTKNDDEAMVVLLECTRIAMKQYYPEISKSIEDLEDNIDLPTVHEILDIAGNIKINADIEEDVKTQAQKGDAGPSWEDFDLAKLESEIFLLGIWKDYNELEESLSLSEIMAIVSSKRELDYQEKKFFAAIQGVDLEDNDTEERGQKEWENLKARVFSGGATNDSDDVLALQGQNAQKAGFGIGMGLDYEDARDPSLMV